MIKNLNQLKRRLRPGTRLEVTGHCRPGCIGQLREVTWVNTQGVYTKNSQSVRSAHQCGKRWTGLHNVVGCSQHLVI